MVDFKFTRPAKYTDEWYNGSMALWQLVESWNRRYGSVEALKADVYLVAKRL